MPEQPQKNLLAPESTLLYAEFEPGTPKCQEISPGIEPSPADSDEGTAPKRAQSTSKTSEVRYRSMAKQLRKNLLDPESTLLSDELPRLALVARLVEAAVSLDSAGRKEALTMPEQPRKNLLAHESTLLYAEFEPGTPKRQEIAPGIEPSPEPASKTSEVRYR
ncbi:hypothetical protein [Rhodococcus koreensis]|uniref:hypothetical protein n=1 Tax=Rhodococcus koreensis TaxID=99653 RepID=UPI0036700745